MKNIISLLSSSKMNKLVNQLLVFINLMHMHEIKMKLNIVIHIKINFLIKQFDTNVIQSKNDLTLNFESNNIFMQH